MSKKTFLQKSWHFLWVSNSWLSWVVNVILAFIIIKFLLYPGIGLILGTPLPVVAVISESMEHEQGDDWLTDYAQCERGPCTQEAWYINKGISAKDFEDFPFKGGFNKGDIMLLIGKKSEDIQIGEIIVFDSNPEQKASIPIIHRVVGKRETDNGIRFETKGDNNPNQIKFKGVDEKNIHAEDVLGIAKIRIPLLGWVKIAFSELISWLR